RQLLPISDFRDEIIQTVNKHQVVVLSGETGCGKSTQLPQFLAEEILTNATCSHGQIICTQPRRISAMSIAQRVSLEMGDRPKTTGLDGSLVGYQIRMENQTSPSNVLVFCTTGILLRRLENDQDLTGIKYVIIDEVHERSMESDFLMVILQRIRRSRPDLRIVLMSATINAEKFSAYFDHCPMITVPGRTFPVDVYHLEDIVEKLGRKYPGLTTLNTEDFC
ncbi:P-loop containing nucleoside triphosphate hydrolase protein, partial [Hesseltinella vesiculosa]